MTIHSEHPFLDPEPERDPVRRFRGRLGGTVTLWASTADGDRAGLTVSSLMVALGEPARVLALVDPDSDLAEVAGRAGTATVMLLEWHHRELADAFAGVAPAPGGPFRIGTWADSDWGPVLEGASAWAGLRFSRRPEAGGLVAAARRTGRARGARRGAAAPGAPAWPVRTRPAGIASLRAPEEGGGVEERIRVMVVDDHPMWRDGVARDLTEAGMEVVATAASGTEALTRAAAARPQVVVLDLQIPEPNGVEVTARLIKDDPARRVLILSASGEQQDVLDAVKAGATGYLVKSASRAELLAAVARVAEGDTVFTPGLAGLVLGEYRRLSDGPRVDDPGAPRLTDRETEVLRLVAKGLSYKQIADRLVLSHRTVQNHVQNTLRKLQMHNRVQLVRYAIEQGLDEEA